MAGIFKHHDLCLLRHELVTYGISYLDTADALVVGGRFIKNPDLADFYVTCPSPALIIELLREPYGSNFIGARFELVSELIAYYWNGTAPSPCPSSYIADLVNICLAEPESAMYDLQEDQRSLALTMHDKARELISEIEFIPQIIVDRILDNIPYKKELTH